MNLDIRSSPIMSSSYFENNEVSFTGFRIFRWEEKRHSKSKRVDISFEAWAWAEVESRLLRSQ